MDPWAITVTRACFPFCATVDCEALAERSFTVHGKFSADLQPATLKSILRQAASRIGPMRYAVVIEKGERNCSAYVPDLPGCVSVGDTPDEVKAEIREAIQYQLEGMREDGFPIPTPSSRAEYVEVGEQAA